MRKLNKKGFTIVELVIVIAVIAILAAVLIPTFAGIIHKANVSNDTQLVKNLNTALAADTTKNYTMTDALDAAAEFGYDIEKINASATDNEILWDSVNNLFCYINDGAIEYIPDFEPKEEVKAYQYWQISDTVPATADQKYSIYYTGTETAIPTLTVGFDVGNTTGIAALEYNRADATIEEAQSVVIRTNGGTLTVNAPYDDVMHVGTADVVNVDAVADNSYEEFGKVVNTLFVKKGHVIITENASAGYVVVTGNGVILDVKNDTPFFALDTVESVTITDKSGTAVTEFEKVSEEDLGEGSRYLPAEIDSVDDLAITSDSTKDTSSASAYVLNIASGYYILSSDLELTHANAEKQFSKYVIGEAGSEIHIDLNGYTIDMTNVSLYACDGTKVYLSNGNIKSTLLSNKGEGVLFVDNKGELYLDSVDIVESTADYIISTNATSEAGSVFYAKDSSLTFTATSGVHYAAALKAEADYTFINCTLSATTGGVTMKGGDLYMDGCTVISSDAYGADYDTAEKTLAYCQKANTPGFGDGILISDRNSSYTLNSVTVKNTKFMHEGDNIIGAFGLRVVDCVAEGDDTQAVITLENLSFSDNLAGRTVTVCGTYGEENWIAPDYECEWIISAE